ncbi:MAG: hypothetical protein H6822_23950 [Planctomycetaceae bacterium]|nr:hypothetical protein [Planctomycetales bacterium]MCB9925254.1 hypothetical protein [Planctomycetaceae bacterium]
MAARKRKESDATDNGSRMASGFAGLIGATVVIAGLMVAAFFAWKHWAKPVLQISRYQLTPENLRIPPPPPWIRTDIKAEVFRDASLSDASALEEDLTPRVAHAFEMHPWVAEVTRVSKQAPSNVIVDLTYRQPIAWVEVPEGMFGQQGQAALPIDGESVLLPQDGFTPEDLGLFIRIDVENLSMCGPTGAPWGDPRVAGAAAIATILGDQWRELGLYEIKVVADYSRPNIPSSTRYELLTPKEKRLIWGSAPGAEFPGELPAIAKVRLLRDYVQKRGRLDESAVLGLDLRSPESIRTALLPR